MTITYPSRNVVQSTQTTSGLNANMLGRWSRELTHASGQAFRGQGKLSAEALVTQKRQLARVKREQGFLKEAAENSTGHCNTSASLSAGELKSSVLHILSAKRP